MKFQIIPNPLMTLPKPPKGNVKALQSMVLKKLKKLSLTVQVSQNVKRGDARRRWMLNLKIQ
jgi:hypothetical protein